MTTATIGNIGPSVAALYWTTVVQTTGAQLSPPHEPQRLGRRQDELGDGGGPALQVGGVSHQDPAAPH